MRQCEIMMHGEISGTLRETESGFSFYYYDGYIGQPISLTMPVQTKEYSFTSFPPFFDGLLPEGMQLDAMLRLKKLDRDDLFGQLIAVGADLVGAVTVESSGV